MRKIILLTTIFMGLTLAGICQRPFTAGNIVVYRVGDGTTTLGFTAVPIYLDEYTPTGTLVQSILMPTVASGANQVLTCSGSATSGGLLNLSGNGKYLVVSGYNAAPGSSSATAQVVGLVDYNGIVNTSTTNPGITFLPNTAVSDNGSNIWFDGSGAINYT